MADLMPALVMVASKAPEIKAKEAPKVIKAESKPTPVKETKKPEVEAKEVPKVIKAESKLAPVKETSKKPEVEA